VSEKKMSIKLILCSEQNLRNIKPQQTALSGGSLLMLSSGIHFGFSFYNWNENRDVVSWSKSYSSTLISFAVVAWFVGSIVGFILAPLSQRTFSSQKVIYVRRIMQVFFNIVILYTLNDFWEFP
jgi:uncharacterized protein YacL